MQIANKDIESKGLENFTVEQLVREIDKRKETKIPELVQSLNETLRCLSLYGIEVASYTDRRYSIEKFRLDGERVVYQEKTK